MRLEYRGITTHHVKDRTGGADPYLIAGFYRIPHELSGITRIMHEMTSPMKIEHRPHNLQAMAHNEWSPSGGKQDRAGNPSNPIQFYPKYLRSAT